ncbi:MAG TPA: hypothetical protein VJI68_02870 [Candidatus Nanoarchaeia archaeon]|nr:hypothetical protein [Candidatus Nanoarchaeia archaeon]
MDIDKTIKKNVEILEGKVKGIRSAIPFTTDQDTHYVSLPFATETTFRDDLDGDKIKTPIWTIYHSYTGDIVIPEYGQPQNTYTKVLIFQTDSPESPLDPFDSNVGNVAAFVTATKRLSIDGSTLVIPGCGRGVEDILSKNLPIIPYRLVSLTKEQWESNPFGRRIQALNGRPDKFSNYPGDGIFLASVEEYNERCRKELAEPAVENRKKIETKSSEQGIFAAVRRYFKH